MPNVYCQRAFQPQTDMEELMREEGIPLFSIESKTPLREMDMVGFTLQYEMSFTTVLNMIDLAGIPMFARDRGEDMPLIVCGGPCAYNPEPLWEFADAFPHRRRGGTSSRIHGSVCRNEEKRSFQRRVP